MVAIHYVWDELSDNVLKEVDDTGTTTAEYTNEPSQFGELISQRRDSTDSYFTFDAQRSTRQLTSDDETETDSYAYSAFGELLASSGTTENPFRYNGAVGYYTDTESGEIYIRRRTYQPILARWLSTDPLQFIDGPNAYNPYFAPGRTDPSGMACQKHCCCCVKGLGIDNILVIDDIWWGHSFDVNFSVTYIEWDGPRFSDCTLEFWEFPGPPLPRHYIDRGILPNQWVDIFPHFGHGPIFREWNNRDKECPSSDSGTITDPTAVVQGFGKNLTRDARWAIRLRSAPDCCSGGITVYAKQKLTLRDGDGVDPSWFKRGLSDKELEGLPPFWSPPQPPPQERPKDY